MIFQLATILVAATSLGPTRAISPGQRGLLLLIPEHAAGAVYVRRLGAELDSPPARWLTDRVLGDWSFAAPLMAAAGQLQCPGLAVLLSKPKSDEKLRLLVAVDLANSNQQPEQFINQQLLPQLRRSTTGAAKLSKDGLLGQVSIEGWSDVLHWTKRGARLLLSTDRELLSGLQAGRWPSKKLLLTAGWAGLAEGLTPETELWMYADLPQLYHLAGPITARDPFLQRLYWLIGVENFRAATLQVRRGEKATALRVICRFADPDKGVMRLAAGPNTVSRAVDLLGPESPVVLRMSLSDLREGIGALNSLIEQLDPEIVKEFETERAAFKTDIGFDPLDDLAGKIREEIVVALVPLDEGGRGVVLIAGLADESDFADHMAALSRYFDIDWRQRKLHDFTIYTPEQDQGGFAYATGRGRLVIARDPRAIESVLEPMTSSGPSSRRNRRGVSALLPVKNRCSVQLVWPEGISWLGRQVEHLVDLELSGLAGRLKLDGRQVAGAISVRDRTVTIDCVVGNETPDRPAGAPDGAGRARP